MNGTENLRNLPVDEFSIKATLDYYDRHKRTPHPKGTCSICDEVRRRLGPVVEQLPLGSPIPAEGGEVDYAQMADDYGSIPVIEFDAKYPDWYPKHDAGLRAEFARRSAAVLPAEGEPHE